MGCCNGGKRSIRKQVIERPAKAERKKVSVQHVRRSGLPADQQKRIVAARQYVVPRQKCQKCGFPTMAVNIAGRERSQCSNPNCRIVIR
jgi:hypothetical protein